MRVAAYGILIAEGRILLCRLSSAVSGYAGMWTLPGGRIEIGEHPEQCMIREVEEETGFQVQAMRIMGIDSLYDTTQDTQVHSLRIMYEAQIVGGTMRFEEHGTTDLCEWHSLDELDMLPRVGLVDAATSMLQN